MARGSTAAQATGARAATVLRRSSTPTTVSPYNPRSTQPMTHDAREGVEPGGVCRIFRAAASRHLTGPHRGLQSPTLMNARAVRVARICHNDLSGSNVGASVATVANRATGLPGRRPARAVRPDDWSSGVYPSPRRRDLSAKHHAYILANGIPAKVRVEDEDDSQQRLSARGDELHVAGRQFALKFRTSGR